MNNKPKVGRSRRIAAWLNLDMNSRTLARFPGSSSLASEREAPRISASVDAGAASNRPVRKARYTAPPGTGLGRTASAAYRVNPDNVAGQAGVEARLALRATFLRQEFSS
jgi:hypothetical protein